MAKSNIAKISAFYEPALKEVATSPDLADPSQRSVIACALFRAAIGSYPHPEIIMQIFQGVHTVETQMKFTPYNEQGADPSLSFSQPLKRC